MMCPEVPFAVTGAALRAAVLFCVEKSLGLHRQMHLVGKRRVAAGREQAGVVGDRFAERLDPGPIALGEIRQYVAVHHFLDTGMTDPDAYPAILVANMGRDRTQAVMPRNAAADLDPHLAGRQFEFVLKHRDVALAELEETGGFLHRAPRLVHESRGAEHHHPPAIERAFRGLALKTTAPWCETMTPR